MTTTTGAGPQLAVLTRGLVLFSEHDGTPYVLPIQRSGEPFTGLADGALDFAPSAAGPR